MKCRSCCSTVYTERSDLCLPCAAAETLTNEFRSSFGSETIKNLATDVIITASRQVRALRLFSLRLLEQESGVVLKAKSLSPGRTGEPGGAKSSKDEKKQEAKAKEEEEYSYYSEPEESRDQEELDEESSLSYPTKADREARETKKSERPPAVTSKSAPVVKPVSTVPGRKRERTEGEEDRRKRSPSGRHKEDCRKRRNRQDQPEDIAGSSRRSRGFALIPDKRAPLAGSTDPKQQEAALPERYLRLPTEGPKKDDKGKGSGGWQQRKRSRRRRRR